MNDNTQQLRTIKIHVSTVIKCVGLLEQNMHTYFELYWCKLSSTYRGLCKSKTVQINNPLIKQPMKYDKATKDTQHRKPDAYDKNML